MKKKRVFLFGLLILIMLFTGASCGGGGGGSETAEETNLILEPPVVPPPPRFINEECSSQNPCEQGLDCVREYKGSNSFICLAKSGLDEPCGIANEDWLPKCKKDLFCEKAIWPDDPDISGGCVPEDPIAWEEQRLRGVRAEQKGPQTCAAAGGAACGGCCKEAVASSDVESCCRPNTCVQRIQQKKAFSEIGESTIELFANGEVGIFYGPENSLIGNPNYAVATPVDGNKYTFKVKEKEYTFTMERKTCEIIIS